MGIGPYQARAYDNSRSTARLSDLAEQQGAIEAGGHLRGGQVWGGAVERIGHIGGKMMSDLAEERETRPIREARTQEAKDYLVSSKRKEDEYQQTAKRAAEFKALAPMTAGMDDDEVIGFYRREGHPEAASSMAKELADTRKRNLETTKLTLDVTNQKLTRAGILMGSVKDAPDPAGAYASALPEIRDLVGERLAGALPEQYDEAFVGKALTWGASQKDKLSMQADLLRIEDQTGKSKQERDEYFTKSLGALLGTATSQDDWDLIAKGARDYGAPAFTVEKFGKEFSPEAVARAKTLSTPQRADNPTSEEQDMESFARGQGLKSAGELTYDQRRTVQRQRAETGRRPVADRSGLTGLTKITPQDYQKLLRDVEEDYQAQLEPEDDGYGNLEPPSAAQRGAAIRWRSSTMRQLDTLARKSGINPGSLADLAGEAQPAGWRAPMAPGRVMPKPKGEPAPRPAPPVNFRKPSDAPSSSSQPVGLTIPGRGVQYFPNVAARDAFMRDMGWTLK